MSEDEQSEDQFSNPEDFEHSSKFGVDEEETEPVPSREVNEEEFLQSESENGFYEEEDGEEEEEYDDHEEGAEEEQLSSLLGKMDIVDRNFYPLHFDPVRVRS